MSNWQMNKQCDECPWRSDVAPGQFTVTRFEALRGCVEQGFARMFACHKSPEEDKRACVGYVMNALRPDGPGPQNFNLRHALGRYIEPEKMTLVGPQYETYDDMVEATRLVEEARRRKRDKSSSQDRGEARAGHHPSGDQRLLRRQR